jgi:hypothetical protein
MMSVETFTYFVPSLLYLSLKSLKIVLDLTEHHSLATAYTQTTTAITDLDDASKSVMSSIYCSI